MPDEDKDPMQHAKAWQAVAGQEGWLVLMEHANGFKSPRLVISDQDEYFLKETARGLWPKDKFKVIQDGATKKRFFVRLPAT